LLNDREVAAADQRPYLLPEFDPESHSSHERELRSQVCTMVRRAYRQQLMTSTEGTVSVRVGDDAFLVTPYGIDRGYLSPADLVLVDGGRRERGKIPSRSVQLHRDLYRRNSECQAVIFAQPPHCLAFAVTGQTLDTRSIPESYVVLREIPLLPFSATAGQSAPFLDAISERAPVALVANDAICTTGKSLLEAYDKLEVAEFSAQAIIDAQAIGKMEPMEAERIIELKRAFNLP